MRQPIREAMISPGTLSRGGATGRSGTRWRSCVPRRRSTSTKGSKKARRGTTGSEPAATRAMGPRTRSLPERRGEYRGRRDRSWPRPTARRRSTSPGLRPTTTAARRSSGIWSSGPPTACGAGRGRTASRRRPPPTPTAPSRPTPPGTTGSRRRTETPSGCLQTSTPPPPRAIPPGRRRRSWPRRATPRGSTSPGLRPTTTAALRLPDTGSGSRTTGTAGPTRWRIRAARPRTTGT